MVSKWSILSRLRNAVKKVKFLLSFNVNRWRIASMIGAPSWKRRLSFNDRPGLRACTDDDDDYYYTQQDSSPDSATSCSGSHSRSRNHRELHRTISYPSEDDIDKRAELFIANFHKQLQIERQVSLELRYCRANSFEFISP